VRSINLAVCVLVLALAPPVLAGSLVNPGFDSDVSGWNVVSPTVWDALDADGSGSSGSVLMTYDVTSGGGTITFGRQCLAVLPGEYAYGAMSYVPPGEPDVTAGRVLVFTYASGDCSGEVSQFVVSPENTEQDQWINTGGNISISAGEASVEVRLGVSKGSGVSDPGSAHLDNVYFNSTEDQIFKDRFQSGE
jgi:hypothetical protein